MVTLLDQYYLYLHNLPTIFFFFFCSLLVAKVIAKVEELEPCRLQADGEVAVSVLPEPNSDSTSYLDVSTTGYYLFVPFYCLPSTAQSNY